MKVSWKQPRCIPCLQPHCLPAPLPVLAPGDRCPRITLGAWALPGVDARSVTLVFTTSPVFLSSWIVAQLLKCSLSHKLRLSGVRPFTVSGETRTGRGRTWSAVDKKCFSSLALCEGWEQVQHHVIRMPCHHRPGHPGGAGAPWQRARRLAGPPPRHAPAESPAPAWNRVTEDTGAVFYTEAS